MNDIALLNPDGRPEILARVETPDKKRFNDVIADPAGCIFAGTIGTGDGLGGLYRVGAGGVATRLFLGSRTANGMAFSPDRKLFYWTCSTTRRIFRFDYDAATGKSPAAPSLSNFRRGGMSLTASPWTPRDVSGRPGGTGMRCIVIRRRGKSSGKSNFPWPKCPR